MTKPAKLRLTGMVNLALRDHRFASVLLDAPHESFAYAKIVDETKGIERLERNQRFGSIVTGQRVVIRDAEVRDGSLVARHVGVMPCCVSPRVSDIEP